MPDPFRAAPRIALAFDFGRRRIGMAAGDTLTATAAPRPAVAAHDGVPDWTAIAREVRALSPHILIVGVPYNADGSDGSLAQDTRDFAAQLGVRFALPWSRWTNMAPPWKPVACSRTSAPAVNAAGACTVQTSTAPLPQSS